MCTVRGLSPERLEVKRAFMESGFNCLVCGAPKCRHVLNGGRRGLNRCCVMYISGRDCRPHNSIVPEAPGREPLFTVCARVHQWLTAPDLFLFHPSGSLSNARRNLPQLTALLTCFGRFSNLIHRRLLRCPKQHSASVPTTAMPAILPLQRQQPPRRPFNQACTRAQPL